MLASVAPEVSRKISQPRSSDNRYMSHPTTTIRNSFTASRGYVIHVIRCACLVPGNLAVYLSLSLMIRYVSAAPAGTASDNSKSSPTVIVAIVVACLGLPSAIWALLQIWQWFSGEHYGSPSGWMGNPVFPALQSNNGTIRDIHGGDWSQNEDSSRPRNRHRGVSLSQEGSEERDALLGTPDLSSSTTSISSDRDGEGLELGELNGRTALPYRGQQRAARASVSMTVGDATAPTGSQGRIDVPADEHEELLLQQDI